MDISQTVDQIYREDGRKIFATLIRLLGNFDLAEESMQEAFSAALKQWAIDGIPANPQSWLISTSRFKAIDNLRRQSRSKVTLEELAKDLATRSVGTVVEEDAVVEDDRLRLIFTCCHPSLSLESQIALTLREVCGLKTEEIASAFLTSPTTLAQRIVRAKSKIRDAMIPFQIPSKEDLPERLDAVLHVIYLVFNEGYSASEGESLTKAELTNEAIRLGRLLSQQLPSSEVIALLALMLLHESRRQSRLSESGELVLLAEQDRNRWDKAKIEEGIQLVEKALASKPVGPYAIQAAIAAIHAEAPNSERTDWVQIVALYNLLESIDPSPIIRLNRAVAVAMTDGPSVGLAIIDQILESGELSDYYLAYSARAEMYKRLGRLEDARNAFEKSLSLAKQKTEQRFLKDAIQTIKSSS